MPPPSGSPKCLQHTPDPEQDSEDCDWLPSKGRGVPPHIRDWGPPPEGAPRTVSLQPMYPNQLIVTSLPDPPPSGPFSRPLFIAPSEAYVLEVTTPMPSCHLWWRPGGGHLSPNQTPLRRPDVVVSHRGD